MGTLAQITDDTHRRIVGVKTENYLYPLYFCLFFVFFDLEMSLFQSFFVPINVVSSLYGEYVFPFGMESFLPCDHGLHFEHHQLIL